MRIGAVGCAVALTALAAGACTAPAVVSPPVVSSVGVSSPTRGPSVRGPSSGVTTRVITTTTTPTPTGATATTPTATPTMTVSATRRLVAQVRWIKREGERVLVVVPTTAGRHEPTYAAGAALWDQVVARVPDADRPGMRDQLICHVVFAATKSAWYLEPRRPAVGWMATVGAGCNPGTIRDPDLG